MQGVWKLVLPRRSVPWIVSSLIVHVIITQVAAEELTVDMAVRLALEHNVTLQAQQQTLAVAEGVLQQARTFPYNPRLAWEGSAGRE